MRSFINAAVFTIAVCLIYIYIAAVITDISGGAKSAVTAAGVSPEAGEVIFWGKGRCYTCHSMGNMGSGIRCPNLGAWGDQFPLAIGQRAAERAKEREAQTGKPYASLDYLIESIAEPPAYVVGGFKNEMPTVYAPPISLTLEEMKAVISYLMSQGGEADIEAINNPPEIGRKLYSRIAAATAAGGGDPSHGEKAFSGYRCTDCHRIKGEGGEVGPDLTDVGTKDVNYISESILDPSARFTEGYKTYKVRKKDGSLIVGIKRDEGPAGIEIMTERGEVLKIAREDIGEVTQEVKSIMPEDTREFLTVKDYQDILAFLILQKRQK